MSILIMYLKGCAWVDCSNISNFSFLFQIEFDETKKKNSLLRNFDIETELWYSERFCYFNWFLFGFKWLPKICLFFLYPDTPGMPNITGLRDQAVLFEGQRKRLTCLSMAGNPLPSLKWFKGNEEITGTTTHKDKSADYSRSELIITANRSDNGIEYKCEAKNEAIESALSTKVKLLVQFKPSEVSISVEPETPKAGKKATLTCKSGSSNPQASIVWRKVIKNVKSSEVLQGVTENTTKDCGEPAFGGKCTTNKLEINVTSELHGAVYVCEATNEELRESVHNAKTLSVNCKYF